MLVLSENKGKSVVLQSLVNSNPDHYAIVYDREHIATLDTLFVSSAHTRMLDFVEMLSKEIRKEDKCREFLIVYTNLSEADAFVIKDMVEELEDEGFCRYGIVMCKE